MNRLMDQDCFGRLITEAWLASNFGLLWSLPGAIVRNGELEREVDILGLSRAGLFVGEVKTRAGGLRVDDVRKTVEIAGRVAASHVVFSILEGPMQATATAVGSASRGGLELVWLTEDDLFS